MSHTDTYAWTIVRDHIADPKAKAPSNSNAVGVVGPRGASMSSQEIKDHPDSVYFQMGDDDGTLYYDGYMLHGDKICSLTNEAEESDGFEPLDDFGEPNAGCTWIKYRGKDGKMHQL